MSTRVSTKSPPPTQANVTKKVSLPTDENTTSVLPLSKTSVTDAEELTVNNDHNYAMHASPYAVFPTYEGESLNVTLPPPLHEVKIVAPATVKEENGSDESDNDNDYENDFEDPNWYLQPNVDGFTSEDVKDDTLFLEETEKDCTLPTLKANMLFWVIYK